MPNPTLTQRVVELDDELKTVSSKFDKALALNESELDEVMTKLNKIEAAIEKLQDKQSELSAKIAALEAQTKAIEKISDRHWQVWLALGGAILALLVSLLKK